MPFNQATASAASGDIVVSLTPIAANNLELVCTSAWQTPDIPAGWTSVTSGFYWRTSPDTNPLTFDATSPSPISQWAALMLDLPTLATPALEQQNLLDFGSFPSFHPYMHTYSGGTALNAGDCIIWCIGMNNVSSPVGLNVSDTQGNTYQIFRFTQLVSGVYCTTIFAIAFGAQAGTCTTSFDITTGTSGTQSFALSLFTFSGVAVPPPPIPPVVPVAMDFQVSSGAPLANGSVVLRLSQDTSIQLPNGPQTASGRVVTVTLDSNGSATPNLRPTEGFSPSVAYQVQAFTASGQPAWRGQLTVSVSGVSHFTTP